MITILNAVWKNPDRRIILASQSPRRREILSQMGFAFEVVAPSVDNEAVFFTGAGIADCLKALAVAKAESVSRAQPGALVVGADTVVAARGTVLGKPKNKSDARTMIGLLSGTSHGVYTSVALVCAETGFIGVAVEKTLVFFRPLEQWEIDDYLESDDFLDKAGAYAIQGRAMPFVDKIEGCYYNVVGLPVRKTIDLFTAYSTRKDARNA
jgi:septum formation protein